MGKQSGGRRSRERARRVDGLYHLQPHEEVEFSDLIAIDPGDRWTGVAFFRNGDDGWYCQDAVELSYWEFVDGFESLLLERPGTPSTVVYEIFRLYGDKARTQTGSQFETSQMIGIIKYLCRVNNLHFERHKGAVEAGKILTCELRDGMCADPEAAPIEINLVGQVADIKKPTAGILRHKGIKSVAKPISKAEYGGRDHVVDAELHGWKHILGTLEGKAAPQD